MEDTEIVGLPCRFGHLSPSTANPLSGSNRTGRMGGRPSGPQSNGGSGPPKSLSNHTSSAGRWRSSAISLTVTSKRLYHKRLNCDHFIWCPEAFDASGEHQDREGRESPPALRGSGFPGPLPYDNCYDNAAAKVLQKGYMVGNARRKK